MIALQQASLHELGTCHVSKCHRAKILGRHGTAQIKGRSLHTAVRAAAPQDAPVDSGLIKLGGSQLLVSRIGLGTLGWGDPGSGYGTRYEEEDLFSTFETGVAAGCNFFDTAEVYGYQGLKSGEQSEQLLSGFIRRAGSSQGKEGAALVVGTKYFTVPWTNALMGGGFRLGRQAMLDALTASLERLQTPSVDLYQVHFPFPTASQSMLASGMMEAMDQGSIRAVGVCNYNASQMEAIHSELVAAGIPLASNQVKYSILSRDPEKSGLLRRCSELNVQLVAHTPLEQGLLTGRYVEEGGDAKAAKVRPLLKVMKFIGTLYGGKTIPQVALNYLVAKGALPIPGAKSMQQATDLMGALAFKLEDNEVAIIDEKLEALGL